MRYIIEDYKPEDISNVIKMHHQSWLDTYPNKEYGVTVEMINKRFEAKLTDESIAKTKQRILDEADDPNCLSLIAKSKNGVVIGLIFATKNSNYGEVNGIYTAKEYHGKGLGSALMNRALKFMDPEKPVHVHVASYNKRAKRFYEKFGFVDQGDIETENFPEIPERLMLRRATKL